MKPLIVTGMSGAGKHTAIQVLEDFGFNCVDNLPVPLLKEFGDMHFSGRIQGAEHTVRGDEESKYAVVIDIRNGKNLGELASILDELDQDGKERFLEFIRGARFALSLEAGKRAV